MNILQEIDKANHILIVANRLSLTSASALYTYILTLHKKVSIACEDVDRNLSFLPWFDKVKNLNSNSSADLKIDLDISSTKLFYLFKDSGKKINKKMATAIYAGLIKETNGFTNTNLNGTIFAMAKELVELGAEFKICNEFILKSTSLSLLRLKAIMLQGMQLKSDATLAILSIDDDMLKACGSKEEDAYLVMQEVLQLHLVKEVILHKSDEENKILKIIKKEL